MPFIKNPYGTNELLNCNNFFISYNAHPCNYMPGFGSDGGGAETALVNHADRYKFRILNGDFRKEYEELAPLGWEACLDFYNKMKGEFQSSWSSDYFSDL